MSSTHEAPFPPIEALVPHRPPMLLVDRVVECRGDVTASEATLRADHLFARDGLVPAEVGVEMIAQTVAAFVGIDALSAGEKPKVGFLTSCRDLVLHVPWFRIGDVLRIEVRRVWGDVSAAQFAGAVLRDGDIVVRTVINVALAGNATEHRS